MKGWQGLCTFIGGGQKYLNYLTNDLAMKDYSQHCVDMDLED